MSYVDFLKGVIQVLNTMCAEKAGYLKDEIEKS